KTVQEGRTLAELKGLFRRHAWGVLKNKVQVRAGHEAGLRRGHDDPPYVRVSFEGLKNRNHLLDPRGRNGVHAAVRLIEEDRGQPGAGLNFKEGRHKVRLVQ